MDRPYTIGKLIKWTTEYFKKAGVDSPRLDAELLLAHCLNLSRVQLYVDYEKPLQSKELDVLRALVKARAAREPLAYLIGYKEFFSIKFKVNPATLIPRPETEHLVEEGIRYVGAIHELPSSEAPKILDLATGSGCVLLSLLKNLPQARGVGVEISQAALEVAQQNAEPLGLQGRAKFIQADLRESLIMEEAFDLITANLPYVSEQDFSDLAPEIKNYEPKAALVPGPTGLEAFDWVFAYLPNLIKPHGLALFEIGDDQAEVLLKKVEEVFPAWQVEVLQDLAGKDRVLKIKTEKL